ncbi:hypothetical protein ACQUW5_06910 [Legionella sp. CNM-1927-20]|uniref:hypothetical protein n=1 Tax=Legionella sp. CNM-1927-20 TaxID=3422221 RepID=UPI00403A9729
MLEKYLLPTEGEYIVSYISLKHTMHALLAISKKVENQYVLVNSIGLMQVNQNISNREHVERDVQAIHELINPGRDETAVYAKHYRITNNQAKGLLDFIQKQRGRRFSFSEFSRNCHNFVIATLSFLGIHDENLINCILPPRDSSTLTTLTRQSVPRPLLQDANYTFYGENKETANKDSPNNLTTWAWPENIEIIDKIEYKPNLSYFKIIEKPLI